MLFGLLSLKYAEIHIKSSFYFLILKTKKILDKQQQNQKTLNENRQ